MAKLGIYDDGSSPHSINLIQSEMGHKVEIATPESIPPTLSCMIVPGGDRGVRKYYLDTASPSIPVLGVSEGETEGLLAQVDVKDVRGYAERLIAVDYNIDYIPRLAVTVDEQNRYHVLNDATVCSTKSSTLMEYLLTIDGEEFWHDNSDGVIIATPLGSTAYAMSAGGPVIFAGSPVFGVVSINSQDVERRPLIVPQDSTVVISEVSSRRQCEVMLDGAERIGIRESVRFSKSDPPAGIIRLKKDTISISAMAKRHQLSEDLFKMAPSAKLLLKTLEYEGTLSRRKLAERTMLPDRTVRMSLASLVEKGYVKRRVSVRDARQKLYEIAHPTSPQN